MCRQIKLRHKIFVVTSFRHQSNLVTSMSLRNQFELHLAEFWCCLSMHSLGLQRIPLLCLYCRTAYKIVGQGVSLFVLELVVVSSMICSSQENLKTIRKKFSRVKYLFLSWAYTFLFSGNHQHIVYSSVEFFVLFNQFLRLIIVCLIFKLFCKKKQTISAYASFQNSLKILG